MGAEKNTAKQSKKLRLNVVDFLIVIIIIGAIVGIALRFGVIEKVTNQSALKPARVSFLIQDINDLSADYINIGDEFKSVTHNCVFGKLESRQILPAEAFVVNEYGQLNKTYSENHRIDVRGTFIVDGTFTEEGFLLAGTNYIAPGSGIRIQSTYIDVYLTVISIDKID
jgi:hypothetical protein